MPHELCGLVSQECSAQFCMSRLAESAGADLGRVAVHRTHIELAHCTLCRGAVMVFTECEALGSSSVPVGD